MYNANNIYNLYSFLSLYTYIYITYFSYSDLQPVLMRPFDGGWNKLKEGYMRRPASNSRLKCGGSFVRVYMLQVHLQTKGWNSIRHVCLIY